MPWFLCQLLILVSSNSLRHHRPDLNSRNWNKAMAEEDQWYNINHAWIINTYYERWNLKGWLIIRQYCRWRWFTCLGTNSPCLPRIQAMLNRAVTRNSSYLLWTMMLNQHLLQVSGAASTLHCHLCNKWLWEDSAPSSHVRSLICLSHRARSTLPLMLDHLLNAWWFKPGLRQIDGIHHIYISQQLPEFWFALRRSISTVSMELISVAGNSRGIGQIIVTTVFLLLATLAVVATVWARKIMRLALSINDYAAIFALVIYLWKPLQQQS